MTKLASMDNMPKITLEGVEFSKLTREQRLSVLNFICGIAFQYDILSSGERKKAYERTQKLINS